MTEAEAAAAAAPTTTTTTATATAAAAATAPVGLRTRLTEVAADTMTQAAIRFYAFRGEKAARLLTPAALANPYPLYDALRQEGAVLRSGKFDAWMVTTHELAAAAVRDNRLSVDNRVIEHHQEQYQTGEGIAFHDYEMMLRMDPPDHTRIRRLVGKAFAPKAIAGWRPTVEKVSAELLADLDPNGFDLVDDYAVPMTVRVICDLLGIPHADWRQFREWGHAVTRTLGVNVSRADRRLALAGGRQLSMYLTDLIARRRSEPADDLLSLMIAAEEEGDKLTDRELLANTSLLLLAGFETTVNLIGNGTLALLDHPDQWIILRGGDNDALANAVDELLRYDSPVQFTGRNVAEDIEIEGHHIPKGKEILVLLGSGNNDPAVFAAPRVLDVTRANAKDHIAFSSGAHYCLGASLARLEGEVAFRDLTERFGRLHLTRKPARRRTDLLRGYERIPVAA